jgi:uncharacterized protein
LVEEPTEVRGKMLNGFAEPSNASTYSLVVMPSAACPHGCNLAQFGAYCGQTHSGLGLPPKEYEFLLCQVAEALKRSDFERYNIGFFGAEPLTRWRDVAKFMGCCVELAQKFNKSNFLYGSITTSGYLLNGDILNELTNVGISEFEVTLDGLKECHDQRRPLKSGANTFDKTVDNIVNARRRYPNTSFKIRANVDKRNADSVVELIDYLASIDLIPWAAFYIAPVRNWGEVSAGDLYNEATWFANFEISIFSKLFEMGARPELLPRPKQRTCVAAAESPAVVAPNGELYFCTEVPLSEHGEGNQAWRDLDLATWREGLRKGSYPCSTCSLLPICGGSCPKDWLKGNPACPPFKQNITKRMQLLSLYEPDCVETLG